MEEIKLIMDQALIDEYAEYYFKQHPKARKKPIEKPWHPSINEWMIMPRPQMNALKQKWKDFGVWWIEKLGYTNMMLDSFEIIEAVYFSNKIRRDVQNYITKFLDDSFVAAGFIVDDDYKHYKKMTMMIDVDKNWPRTEIVIKPINKEEQQ